MKKGPFITTEDFDALSSPIFQEEIIFWKDLPIQVIFRVEHVYLIQTKWGKQLALGVDKSKGRKIRVDWRNR